MTDDQKRALGLGGVGLAGILLYRSIRNRKSGAAQSFSPPSTSGSTQPYTPQAPLPLSPGESVYDPNSEALLNTPSALDNTPGPGNGTQTVASAAPAYTVNVNYPKPTPPPKPAAKKVTKRPVKKKPVRKVVKKK